jgi:transcriptional regulator with XRE-family HTH domain
MNADTPAVARRRLRLALRRAREATGRTQGQVAEALEWSLSKVNRIETGEVTISNTDLQALLRLLDVTDTREVDLLIQDARTARRRGWWHEAGVREHLTPAMSQLLQFENQATAIRTFHIGVFPGLLQTREYAETVLGAIPEGMADETRKVRLDVRMRRQEHFFAAEDPPQLMIVIDEFVAKRTMGNPGIVAAQIRAVIEATRRSNVHVRILPADAPPFTLMGAFTIFDFDVEANAILYREHGMTDRLIQDPDEAGQHRVRYEQIWDLCLGRTASISALEAQYYTLRAQLDRATALSGE